MFARRLRSYFADFAPVYDLIIICTCLTFSLYLLQDIAQLYTLQPQYDNAMVVNNRYYIPNPAYLLHEEQCLKIYDNMEMVQSRTKLLQRSVTSAGGVGGVCKHTKTAGKYFMKLSELPVELTSRMIINHRHKFIFTSSPVETGPWLRFITDIKLFDETGVKPSDDEAEVSMNDLKDDTVRYYLEQNSLDSSGIDNYFKFYVVRNPLSYIISKYEDLMTPDGNSVYVNVSFTQFLEELIETPIQDRGPEFQSQQMSVLPCQVEYDFFVMFEDMSRFKSALCEKIGLNNKLFHYDRLDRAFDMKNATEHDSSFVEGDSELYLRKFHSSYQQDFELYGYTKLRTEYYPYSEVFASWFRHKKPSSDE